MLCSVQMKMVYLLGWEGACWSNWRMKLMNVRQISASCWSDFTLKMKPGLWYIRGEKAAQILKWANRQQDMIWYDMIWYDMIWYDVMWCDVMWCDVMWCDVMWCDVICISVCQKSRVFASSNQQMPWNFFTSTRWWIAAQSKSFFLFWSI